MKSIILFCLAIACVVAEPGVSEWRSEYGAYPTGPVYRIEYDTPIVKYDSPIVKLDGSVLNYEAPIAKFDGSVLKYDTPILKYDPSILKYDSPLYYRLAPKAYTLPAGYRMSYDPENFNEAFGYYPDYKK